jgi:hypothetical protein
MICRGSWRRLRSRSAAAGGRPCRCQPASQTGSRAGG